MPVLTWPAGLQLNGSTFHLRPHSRALESAATRTAVTQELPGARWEAQAEWSLLTRPMQRLLQGLLAALNGQTGTVAMPDFGYDGPQGSAAGNLLATGAAEALAITITGATGSNPVLRAGDRIGVAGRLYMVTADVTAAGGSATVPILPRLRAAAAGAAVATANLTCPMRLIDDGQGAIAVRPPLKGTATVSLVERLP